MKVPIDMLNTVAGWGGTAGATFSLNQNAGDCVAEYQSASLIIHIPANSAGKTITKSVGPVNLAGCAEIVLSIWSRELKRTRVSNPASYFYKVTFDGVHTFMLPTNIAFSDVTFGLNGWNSANQITITPTTNSEDWLIISCCYGLWDEMPLDIMQGVQMGIQNALGIVAPNGIAIGTVSCAAAAPSITPSATTYLDRGAVVLISDGSNSETHQVGRFDEAAGAIWFTSLFDGSATKYAHSGAALQLAFPIQYGVQKEEAAIPAISIWAFPAKSSQDTQDTYIYEDSLDPTGAGALRRTPWMQTYRVLIDCEARQHQVLALLGRIVRWFLGSSRVWINGRAHDMPYPEPSVYIEPDDSVVQIPKLQFEVEIEIHEERALRSWAPAVSGNATITVTAENPAPLGEPAIP